MCLDNHPVFLGADQLLGSVCPGSAEPRSWSELASADQCLKFCDITLSTTTLSTLNNPRNIDVDWTSAANFQVQWSQAHWNACMHVSNSVVNGVYGTPSCLNIKSLFEIRRIAGSKPCSSTFSQQYLNIWLHKDKVRLTKFWNSDRNHRPNALRENVFFPSAFARQTLTLWPDMLNFVWTNHALEIVLILLYFE